MRSAAVSLSVERVDYTDEMAATVVCRVATIADIPAKGSGQAWAIRIELADLDPRGRYGLRSHADLDGDGEVSTGDFVTTEWYPLDPSMPVSSAEVTLREVHP